MIRLIPLETAHNTPVDHNVVPHGDTILVLVNPSTSFATPASANLHITASNSSSESIDSMITHCSDSDESDDNEPDTVYRTPNSVSYKVLKRFLSYASPYFQTMFTNLQSAIIPSPHRESGTKLHLLEAWDSEALLIVLQMMHYQHTEIPWAINVELFGKIVVIAEYLHCTEFARLFLRLWWIDCISQLRRSSFLNIDVDILDDRMMRDAVICAFVAFKWLLANEFGMATWALVFRAPCPVDDLGLSLDPAIIDRLNFERERRLWATLRSTMLEIDLRTGIAHLSGEQLIRAILEAHSIFRLVQIYLGVNPADGYPHAPFTGYSLERCLQFAGPIDPDVAYFSGLSIDEFEDSNSDA